MTNEQFKSAGRIVIYGALAAAGADETIGFARDMPNHPFVNNQFGKLDGFDDATGALALAVFTGFCVKRMFNVFNAPKPR